MDESPISGAIRDVHLQRIKLLEPPPPPFPSKKKTLYHGSYTTSGCIITNICGYSNRCTSA